MAAAQETGLGAAKKLVRVLLCAWACNAALGGALSSVARAELPVAAATSEETPEALLDFDLSPPSYTVGLLGGWVWNRSDSPIHDFLTEQFTLDRSDFDAPVILVDVAWRITSWLDVVGGFEVSSQKTKSEYRDYVDSVTGAPIRQSTQLTQVPLTVSLRFYPLARERQIGEYAFVSRRFVPYAGAGIGATYYELKQKGEFVDFVDDTIFKGRFLSEGWGFSGHVFLGGEIRLMRGLCLAIEGRYQWASADVKGSFQGFDKIDLDGAQLLVGIHWRL
jgi:hypothetical protein